MSGHTGMEGELKDTHLVIDRTSAGFHFGVERCACECLSDPTAVGVLGDQDSLCIDHTERAYIEQYTRQQNPSRTQARVRARSVGEELPPGGFAKQDTSSDTHL